jgi:ABC-2 type transport system ATP-binding protein
MDLFASFYTRTVDTRHLLKRLQLWEKRDQQYTKLSGGQKQRLALALALLNDPQVLFLDEPSAGLDPQARLEIHELVADLRREQRTILLTTHYIEEAEKLCDRVAIVDEGRIIPLGTPREIQDRTLASSTIEVECACALDGDAIPEWPDAEKATLDETGRRISVRGRRPGRVVVELVKWLDRRGNELTDIRIRRPYRLKTPSSNSPERACANESLPGAVPFQHAAHPARSWCAVFQLHLSADLLFRVRRDVPRRRREGYRFTSSVPS